MDLIGRTTTGNAGYFLVCLCKWDNGYCTPITVFGGSGWAYTDSWGHFTVTATNQDYLGLRVYSYFEESNPSYHRIMVVHKDGTSYADAYFRKSNNLGHFDDGEHDLPDPVLISYDANSSPAYWIKNDIQDAYNNYDPKYGSYTIEWENQWSPALDGSYYTQGGNIRINNEDADDTADFVLHEMGHNLMYNRYGSWPPGDTPNPHYIWASENEGSAWKEGWATFWALASTGKCFWDWPDHFNADPDHLDLEIPTWGSQVNDSIDWQNGDKVEGRVTGALWDILDSEQDGLDEYCGGIEKIWNIFTNYVDNTFWSFWTHYRGNFYDAGLLGVAQQNTLGYSGVHNYLQGAKRPVQSYYSFPLTVKLYDEETELTVENILTEEPIYTLSTGDSTIVITNVDNEERTIQVSMKLQPEQLGTYNMTLQSSFTLINLINGVVFDEGLTELDMGKLLEGNPNGDEQVAIGDYTMMLGDYKATPESENWHGGRCDLDGNGLVAINDFALLKDNYGKWSPQTIEDNKLGGIPRGKDSYETVDLSLQSSASEVYVDDQFSVTINVDADTQDLSGIDACLNFNPDYLEVVSVTPGETLTSTLCNRYDNDEGTIDLCLGTSVTGSPVSGSFTMGTIVFRAKAATSNTGITFNSESPRETAIAYKEESLLGTATGTEVTIWGLPTIRATLQGTGRPYPAGFQVPLTLRLYDEELELDENNIMTAEWLYEYTTEDDEIDIFEINQSTKTIRFRVLWDCPDDTYNVTLWDSHVSPWCHTLINLRNGVEIDPSQEEIDMSTLQEGNPNGDVQIDETDEGIVMNDYLSYPGCPEWNDGRSDFNHTLLVNGSDYSLLSMNYGEYSPVVVGGGKLGGEETFTKVDMSLKKSEDTKEISAGSTFTATIEVASKEQKVDAVDAFLAFDPECLEVVSVKPGDALSTVLAKRFDNAKGTLTLCMGRDPKAESASGSFTLGTIEFKAKKEAKETRIAFEQKPPRKTDVAYHGESLLGTATDLILEVKP